MLEKIKGLLGPIFKDLESTIIWIGTAVAVIMLLSAVVKYYQSSEDNERKTHIKWMRVIVVGYIAVHLVAWLVRDYLQPKVGTGTADASVQISTNSDVAVGDLLKFQDGSGTKVITIPMNSNSNVAG